MGGVRLPGKAPEQEKKKITWLLIAAAVIAMISIIITITALVTINPGGGIDDDLPLVEDTPTKGERYSDLMNLFAYLDDEMTEEEVIELMKTLDIDESFLQLNKKYGEELKAEDEDEYNNSDLPVSYIAATTIDPVADYSGQDIEYISFNYLPADEEEDAMIDNIEYHVFHDGKHDCVLQTSEGEFTHIFGDYANSYDSVTDALDDCLMDIQ